MLKILFLVLSIVYTQAQGSPQCRVLGLQAGHDLGAYQAGAFQALVSLLPPGEAAYDVVTGVGVGALNAFWISLFPKGQEAQAAQFLVNQWNTLNPSSLYQSWNENLVNVYLKKSSIYNSSKLVPYLNSFANYGLQRNLSFGATDAVSGDFLIFEESLGWESVIYGLAGTLSQIPNFQNVQWNNYSLVEGDIVSTFDAATGIEKCQDAGFEDSNIIVDVIFLATSKKFNVVNASNYNAVQTLDRAYKIATHNNGVDAYERLVSDYPDVNYRYVVMPDSPLKTDTKPYTYTASQTQAFIQSGAADAKAAIAEYEMINI